VRFNGMGVAEGRPAGSMSKQHVFHEWTEAMWHCITHLFSTLSLWQASNILQEIQCRPVRSSRDDLFETRIFSICVVRYTIS